MTHESLVFIPLIIYVANSSLNETRLVAISPFFVLFVYKLAVNAFDFYSQTAPSVYSIREFPFLNTLKCSDPKINLFKSLEYLNNMLRV